jgi:hypothetical protein
MNYEQKAFIVYYYALQVGLQISQNGLVVVTSIHVLRRLSEYRGICSNLLSIGNLHQHLPSEFNF